MIPEHVLASTAAMAFCIMADHAVDLLTSMEDLGIPIEADERWRTEMAKA